MAAPLLEVRVAYIRQLKFATRDVKGLPIFGTATLLVPRRTARAPTPMLVNNLRGVVDARPGLVTQLDVAPPRLLR